MHNRAVFHKIMSDEARDLRWRIGRNIHDLRMERRLTLAKLVRLCGLAMETIDRLELGKERVGVDHLARLAWGLRVDAGLFLRHEDEGD